MYDLGCHSTQYSSTLDATTSKIHTGSEILLQDQEVVSTNKHKEKPSRWSAECLMCGACGVIQTDASVFVI